MTKELWNEEFGYVPGCRAALAIAVSLWTGGGALVAQTGAVVSAVPGQRIPVQLPGGDKDGVHLTLDQAIGLA